MNPIFYMLFPALLLSIPGLKNLVLFDFDQSSNLVDWYILDDSVMGGVSQGNLRINDEGHAEFYGYVSLENYGGFSSVRHSISLDNISRFNVIRLRVKGDGKRYQFRIKKDRSDRHSYIQYFKTSGEWEDIYIKLDDLYPSFRGRRLNMPNYESSQLAEFSFLIGNKKNENFKLEIDRISLEYLNEI